MRAVIRHGDEQEKAWPSHWWACAVLRGAIDCRMDRIDRGRGSVWCLVDGNRPLVREATVQEAVAAAGYRAVVIHPWRWSSISLGRIGLTA